MKASEEAVCAAYAECQRLARRHYENFPVASRLVPRQKRLALAAIYAFARTADDYADEPGVTGRLAALALWRQKLADCYAGHAQEPIFVVLADAIEKFGLSRGNFEKLLQAFETDVLLSRRPDFASVLAYCECSANPVGRLVLELFGHRDPELFSLSDDICTALQLTNFWQDVGVDFKRDRIYLPIEDLQRFEISEAELGSLSSGERTGTEVRERWRNLMTFEVSRARELFERGRPLLEKVTPQLRRQLRLTWLGGMAILSKMEAAGFDVFRRRPRLTAIDFLRLYIKSRRALAMEAANPAPAVTGRS